MLVPLNEHPKMLGEAVQSAAFVGQFQLVNAANMRATFATAFKDFFEFNSGDSRRGVIVEVSHLLQIAVFGEGSAYIEEGELCVLGDNSVNGHFIAFLCKLLKVFCPRGDLGVL